MPSLVQRFQHVDLRGTVREKLKAVGLNQKRKGLHIFLMVGSLSLFPAARCARQLLPKDGVPKDPISIFKI